MAEPLKLAEAPKLLKLDLACGQSTREGYEGVDVWPEAKHVWDLQKYPWPWADNSCSDLHCSHYIEHIPMEMVDGLKSGKTDGLLRFFDECWRILVPGGVLDILTPNARCNRAFQDPTHRRFIVQETFLYVDANWRKINKLDHYNVHCHYEFSVNPIIPTELSLLHPEAQARRFSESWNTVLDWSAKLKSVKPAPV